MFRKRIDLHARPEWMFVGLGTPGGEYSGTRHNIGFEVIDRLAERLRARLDRGKHQARFGLAMIDETTVLLVKPMTYMNLSGQAISPLMREYQIPIERVVVVADDLDLPVGKVKLKPRGSSGGQRGHKSIIATLGSEEYPRIKIGIGKVDKSATVDHVLSSFTPDERPFVDECVGRAVEGLVVAAQLGMERALTFVNSASEA